MTNCTEITQSTRPILIFINSFTDPIGLSLKDIHYHDKKMKICRWARKNLRKEQQLNFIFVLKKIMKNANLIFLI